VGHGGRGVAVFKNFGPGNPDYVLLQKELANIREVLELLIELEEKQQPDQATQKSLQDAKVKLFGHRPRPRR
jgi:hypothetical protein